MIKKVKIFGLILILIMLFIIVFVPFISKIDEYNYNCKYRLRVYNCRPIESEGEGYDYSDSDTFFFSIILDEKIGGPLEYFGLKKIEKDTLN